MHVKKDSPKLEPLRRAIDKSYENYDGQPIKWVRVHRNPDYAYFNHSAHLNRGIGCVSCHGRIDEMPVVYQAEPHSMGWCLECHDTRRGGLEKNLRPLEHVFDMDWEPADEDRNEFHQYVAGILGDVKANELVPTEGDAAGTEMTQEEIGTALKEAWKIHPPSPNNCAGCHR